MWLLLATLAVVWAAAEAWEGQEGGAWGEEVDLGAALDVQDAAGLGLASAPDGLRLSATVVAAVLLVLPLCLLVALLYVTNKKRRSGSSLTLPPCTSGDMPRAAKRSRGSTASIGGAKRVATVASGSASPLASAAHPAGQQPNPPRSKRTSSTATAPVREAPSSRMLRSGRAYSTGPATSPVATPALVPQVPVVESNRHVIEVDKSKNKADKAEQKPTMPPPPPPKVVEVIPEQEDDRLSTASDVSDNGFADSDDYYEDEEDAVYSEPEQEKRTSQPKTEIAVASMDAEGRRQQQAALVTEVHEMLGVSDAAALLLLRKYKWNKEDLISRYLDDPETVCAAAGVAGIGHSDTLSSTFQDQFECSICRNEGLLNTTALPCGHRYCNDCWRRYLSIRIEEGDTQIRCPAYKCSLLVTEDLVLAVCSQSIAAKYKDFLLNSFVDDSVGVVWCPAPDCGLSVDTTHSSSQFVTCRRNHEFCSRCRMENHAPAGCEVVKSWLKKCDDDSETYNWISANTQDCPKCHSTIEKNGGCNHMTCRKCKHEFCWVCLETWQSHTDYYSCNRYDPDKNVSKEKKEKSRAALDRYLFYYHRYINHENSKKLDSKTRQNAEVKMAELQKSTATLTWGDVQFVGESTDELIKCRQVLQWTYVLAYSMEEESPEKNLFCFLQQDLEQNTERLSGLLESDVVKLLDSKAAVLDLAAVAANSRKKLLHGVSGLSQAVDVVSDV
eukprot:jgi/Chlat1/2856/Chrsp194S03011